MPLKHFKGITTAFVCLSLTCTSSVAAAAPTIASASAVSPWAALAAFGTQASRASLCGSSALLAQSAAVAAAQAAPAQPGCVLPVVDQAPAVAEAAPPPLAPMVPIESGGKGISPLLLGLGALVAAGLIYLLLDDDGDSNSPD